MEKDFLRIDLITWKITMWKINHICQWSGPLGQLVSTICATPLNFPKIPLPTYAPQDFTKISQMPSLKETTQNIQGGSEEYSPKCGSQESTHENWIRTASKYIPALTAYNSSSLVFGEMKHLRFSNPEHKNLNELGQVRVSLLPVKHLAGVDYVKLPMIPSKQTTERSHEPPERKLHCTTEMLGIRFKTDAHKR